ncbi:hypothetical protein IW140_000940 [Coemansia sp. RSA 1813]|nr:hypothetical protein EV178_004835 [Coemansia sp. RSA 1646]KAJ1773391.1 hypothetical protein LPJ74_000644 [Coemansia sp. RSA 1843]KAJ2091608.1 hypothetical protein IW138_001836 [Coemansia sp. RSA 986]KAJ2212395.1 hypothetical protein EV179_004720 [Coemansia sp. RSA 487]KAJ2572191.1 hypothetical protein IW140_000940 [Coemansia sp. RSA 1813]
MAKMVSVSSYHTPGINGRKALGRPSPLTISFSLIEYDKGHRFLIMDCPTDSTISLYIKEFDRLNVTDVVRVCEPTYHKDRLEQRKVRVHDLPFKDGDVPPSSVLKQWLEVVHESFKTSSAKDDASESSAPTTIAVHCVAGLGRAPVLVAVALIERGMDPLDAIEHVRNKRRGAFNNRQIAYLAESYKRSSAFKGANKIMIGSSIRSSPVNSNANVVPDQHHQQSAQEQHQPTNSTHMSIFKKMFFGSH